MAHFRSFQEDLLECLNSSGALRQDFQPLIKNLLLQVLRRWEYYVTFRGRHFKNPASEELRHWIHTNVFNELFERFCDLNQIQPGGFDKGQSDALLTVLAQHFQVKFQLLAKVTIKHLEEVKQVFFIMERHFFKEKQLVLH